MEPPYWYYPVRQSLAAISGAVRGFGEQFHARYG